MSEISATGTVGGNFGIGVIGVSYSVRGNMFTGDTAARLQGSFFGVSVRATFNNDGSVNVEAGAGAVVGIGPGANAFLGFGTKVNTTDPQHAYVAGSLSANIAPTPVGAAGAAVGFRLDPVLSSPARIHSLDPGAPDYPHIDPVTGQGYYVPQSNTQYDTMPNPNYNPYSPYGMDTPRENTTSPNWGHGVAGAPGPTAPPGAPNSPGAPGTPNTPGTPSTPNAPGGPTPGSGYGGTGTGYSANHGWGQDSPSEHRTTPVVIDLSNASADAQQGDGLQFIDLYNSPVFYNSDTDNYKEKTAWVGPNEGIVVFTKDTDGNGTLDRKEIALTNVVTSATTDLEALYIGFDKGWVDSADVTHGAGDHKISWQEAEAQGLKIWQDKDIDGIVDSGEMMSFKDAGISQIDLNNTNVDNLKNEGTGATADQLIETRFSDGSVIFGTASVKLLNGKTTTAYDVGFAHEHYGMLEIKSGDVVTAIKLERPSGGGTWSYSNATSDIGVVWDFDTKTDSYGGTGGDGNDRMTYTGAFARSFSGAKGHDFLSGGDGDDFLIGGMGHDTLRGGDGNDVLYIDADDINDGEVNGGNGFDVLKVNSTAGVTLNMTTVKAEAFFGGEGADVVTAGASVTSVILSGEDGNDQLTGGADSDILIGGAGNDKLFGGADDDQLIGGIGKDTLSGGDGNDYIIADENDDYTHVAGGDGFDVLIIDDNVDNTKVFTTQISLSALDFEAAVGGDGNDVFSTGALSEDTFLIGMGGNDRLQTSSGNDLLSGGKGNDTLMGNDGNDMYVFDRDDGIDVIDEKNATTTGGGTDAVVFIGSIDADEVRLERNGSDLVFKLYENDGKTLSEQKVTVLDWSTVGSRIESVIFGDGTIFDISGTSIKNLTEISDSNFSTTAGTSTLDDVGASTNTNFIDAGAGADNIHAWDGNDILLGRDGNDNLYGDEGHDYLNGGEGDDDLYGGEDDDNLIGGRGTGSDRLYGGSGNDYVEGRDGDDTLSGGSGNDELYGGKGNDSLVGGSGRDVLYGGASKDFLDGGSGDDIYFVGRNEGYDTITDSGSEDDGSSTPASESGKGDHIAFGFDIDITDLVFDSNSAGDLIIGITRAGTFDGSVANIANKVVVKGWSDGDQRIERLNFFNGGVLYVADIDRGNSGGSGNDFIDDDDSKDTLISGGDGRDTLEGHYGNDILIGGKGNDLLHGNLGHDIIFGGADNDDIRGGDGNDRLFGGAGNDVIWGNGDDDNAGQGLNDYIVGGAGNDTARGAGGDDTYFYTFGDGTDRIIEENDIKENTIALGSGIWFSDLKLTYDSDEEKLKLEILPLNRPTENATTVYFDKKEIEDLTFSNGYTAYLFDKSTGRYGSSADNTYDYSGFDYAGVWLNGNGGDDILIGGAGRDVLIGGEQDDILKGGRESDYYVFNAADGHDRIYESSAGDNGSLGGANDTIAFGPAITLLNLSMRLTDGDLVIALRDNDRQDLAPESAENNIRIEDWNGDDHEKRVEWIDFANGTSFNLGEIDNARFFGVGDDTIVGGSNNEWIDAGTGDDTADGNDGDDIMFGRDGNDVLNGLNDNDRVYGEDGNDILRGNGGDDQIYGGLGADSLSGGAGVDYLYGGDGNDKLAGWQGSNFLQGGEGNDIIYRGGYTVNLTNANAAKQVFLTNATTGVTLIEFAKGDGKDTLYVANPNDSGEDGSHDQISLAGIEKEEVWFQKVGDNLVLKILGTEDQMTFVDYYNGADFQFDKIIAGNEKLEAGNINALVQLMAGKTPNDGTSSAGYTSSELPDNILDAISDKWVTYHAFSL